MTALKIIIGLGVFLGLLQFFRTKTVFLKFVLVGLSSCLVLGYFTELPIKSEVFIAFGVIILVFSAWAVWKQKWLEAVIGFFAFLSVLWILFDYPQYNFLQFLMILPLAVYIWTLIKWQKYNHIHAVLTLLASYELSEFVRLLGTWATITG